MRTPKIGEPLTASIPAAGWRVAEMSPNASYKAAARGVIPTVKIGRRRRVPIAWIEAVLAGATGGGGSTSGSGGSDGMSTSAAVVSADAAAAATDTNAALKVAS
jgi:hypothetical protein